jgi:hypothetical protein
MIDPDPRLDEVCEHGVSRPRPRRWLPISIRVGAVDRRGRRPFLKGIRGSGGPSAAAALPDTSSASTSINATPKAERTPNVGLRGFDDTTAVVGETSRSGVPARALRVTA